MSILPPCFAVPDPVGDRGFGIAPSIGASQRASLGRGLAFVLLLAASSLASVYVPLALQETDWVEGTGPVPITAGR